MARPEENVGVYFSICDSEMFSGRSLLGHLFDTIGRKRMIAATYGLAGILLAVTAWLFHAGVLDGANANDCLDDDFLCRISRGELGLLDRERNFPTGNSRVRHRDFLRDRNTGGRSGRAVFVWLDHWNGIKTVHCLPDIWWLRS